MRLVVEADLEAGIAVEPGERIPQAFGEMVHPPQDEPAMIVGEQMKRLGSRVRGGQGLSRGGGDPP